MSAPGNELIAKVMMFAEGFKVQRSCTMHCGVVFAVEEAAFYAATPRMSVCSNSSCLCRLLQDNKRNHDARAFLGGHRDHDTRKQFDGVLTGSAHKVIKEPASTPIEPDSAWNYGVIMRACRALAFRKIGVSGSGQAVH